jgi:hypothetical protein
MNDELFNKFIKKLIDDTKSKKLKWSKSKFFKSDERYSEFTTQIPEIGHIYIGRNEDDDIRFCTREIEIGDGIVQNIECADFIIDYNNDYYVGMMRLYNIVRSTYKRDFPGYNIEKAITAYINRMD